jgi:hypothetical protein
VTVQLNLGLNILRDQGRMSRLLAKDVAVSPTVAAHTHGVAVQAAGGWLASAAN